MQTHETLSDLGQGFHMVAVSDHDHISRSRWSVRRWVKDEGRFWYDGAEQFDDYVSAKRFADRVREQWGDRAVIYSPRVMRRPKAARPWLAESYDVMAIQAKRVLLDALADLRAEA